MYIALTSDTLTDGDLYKYATSQVQQRINILPGVSQVQIFGVKSAIRVKVDPGALASRNMTFDELSTAIRAGTSYAGAGQFDGKNTIVRPAAERADRECGRLPQPDHRARPRTTRRSTCATSRQSLDSVQDERLSRHFFARGFNTPASTIVMAVSRQAGANAVEVARSITRSCCRNCASSCRAPSTSFPRSTAPRASCIQSHDVQETLFIAFVLVVIVIFVFLGRAADTLIPVVALPLSLADHVPRRCGCSVTRSTI